MRNRLDYMNELEEKEKSNVSFQLGTRTYSVPILETGSDKRSHQFRFRKTRLIQDLYDFLDENEIEQIMARRYNNEDLPTLRFYRETRKNNSKVYYIQLYRPVPEMELEIREDLLSRNEQFLEEIITAEIQSFEKWLLTLSPNGANKLVLGYRKVRDYQKKIINGLKELYHGRCQICQDESINEFGIDISEAHHIEHFSVSANNSPNNIIILCPKHHRLLHKAEWYFDRGDLSFISGNHKLKITLEDHFHFGYN